MKLKTNGGGAGMPLKMRKELFKIIRQSERQDISLQKKYEEIFEFIDQNFKYLAFKAPQPPKLRPMSELPTNRVIPFNTLFVLENRECIRFLEVGYSIGSHVKGQKIAVIANKTYTLYNDWRVGDLKIIGWLYELPNPNDIEL